LFLQFAAKLRSVAMGGHAARGRAGTSLPSRGFDNVPRPVFCRPDWSEVANPGVKERQGHPWCPKVACIVISIYPPANRLSCTQNRSDLAPPIELLLSKSSLFSKVP
jgi:hypothetical protein